ncbi:hypothetical protein HBB16_20365 [Pseudonocardia sp. MCCB 268]|nr:hypothetical protein [Pseudonocardia cytotoxica]
MARSRRPSTPRRSGSPRIGRGHDRPRRRAPGQECSAGSPTRSALASRILAHRRVAPAGRRQILRADLPGVRGCWWPAGSQTWLPRWSRDRHLTPKLRRQWAQIVAAGDDGLNPRQAAMKVHDLATRPTRPLMSSSCAPRVGPPGRPRPAPDTMAVLSALVPVGARRGRADRVAPTPIPRSGSATNPVPGQVIADTLVERLAGANRSRR